MGVGLRTQGMYINSMAEHLARYDAVLGLQSPYGRLGGRFLGFNKLGSILAPPIGYGHSPNPHKRRTSEKPSPTLIGVFRELGSNGAFPAKAP